MALPPPPVAEDFLSPSGDITGQWQQWLLLAQIAITQAGAPGTAQYVIQTANASLPSARNLGVLPSGYLKLATSLSVGTVSTAATIPTSDITGTIASSNLTGTLAAAQFPALTGDVTTAAGSLATAIGAQKVTNAMLAGSITLDKLTATTGSIIFAGAGNILSQDNANLFWDATNKRLGIGINIPTRVLHVLNTTDTLAGFEVTGTANRAGLYAQNNTDVNFAQFDVGGSTRAGTAFGLPRAGLVQIQLGPTLTSAAAIGTTNLTPLILGTNNLERIRIDSAGNVGINAVPIHLIDINGTNWPAGSATMFMKQVGASQGLTIQAAGAADSAIQFFDDGTLAVIEATYRASTGYHPIVFKVSNAESVRFAANGTATFSGAANPAVLIQAASAAAHESVRINNTNTTGYSTLWMGAGNDGFVRGGSTAGAFTNQLVFLTSGLTDVGMFVNNAQALLIHGIDGTLNIDIAKKITNYNSIAAVGWGVPAIYGSGRSTAQTGAVASVATYTVGAADGSFLVSMNILVTAFTVGTVSGVITYTDEGNTARSLTMNFSAITGVLNTTVGAAGAFEGVPLHIRAKAATAITVTTTVSAFTGTYNVEGAILQLA